MNLFRRRARQTVCWARYVLIRRLWALALCGATACQPSANLSIAPAVVEHRLSTPLAVTAARPPTSTPAPSPTVELRVLNGCLTDQSTGRPILGAEVYARALAPIRGGLSVSRTEVDAAGCFELESVVGDLELMVAHPGYRGWRVVVPAGWLTQPVALTPLVVRGVYLAREAVGSDEITSAIWDLAASGRINAVAVDVKGDDGLLLYPSRVELAHAIGADGDPIVSDARAFVKRLKARGLYVIARLVTFKDTVLVHARPEWAIGSTDTAVPWADSSGAFWVSPFEREAWPYFAELAAEAIELGFDEVQFDYVRFPSDGDIAVTTYTQDVTAQARVETITAFLEMMRPYVKQNGGFVSADVFGYTAWAHDDQGIGQRVAALTPGVDYLSPMLYPSSLAYGIPGSDLNPLDQPAEVVCSGLEAARLQMGDASPALLRPWLQAFDDYAFDGRVFRASAIQAQIQAADACGARGWLLWNPFNMYSVAAFEAAER